MGKSSGKSPVRGQKSQTGETLDVLLPEFGTWNRIPGSRKTATEMKKNEAMFALLFTRVDAGIVAGLIFSFLQIVPGLPQLLAQAPRVIRALPDHADVDVDPQTEEIRITFDQDMDQSSHSICGGGPTFPDVGKPRWIDPRTFVLPVRLEPGKRYAMSVNCDSFRNFRNKQGVPAVNYPLEFQCSKPGEASKNTRLTAEQNRAAIGKLSELLATAYSYRDLRKIDWNARIEEFRDELTSAATPSEFARSVTRFFANSEDPHIQVKVHDFTLVPYRRPSSHVNFNNKSLQKYLSDIVRHNELVVTAQLADGTPYLLIGGWTGDQASIEPAIKFIEEHRDAKAMVIDVRVNGGGNEQLAREVASCFVKEPVVYSRHRFVDPTSPDGFGKLQDRVVEPNGRGRYFGGQVVVLSGPLCLSSNESFLLMMRQVPNCRLIGDTSGGSSGNPKWHELGNGVAVALPSWQVFLPDGSLLEGHGVKPDIQVSGTAADFQHRDPVLDEALRYLAK